METLDGKLLNDMKQWRCGNNHDHVLGVIEQVQVKLLVNGSTLRYQTQRLIIFRNAIDQSEEIPTEIEVAGTVDGKSLSMIWKCSVAGCGCPKEWHPNPEVVEFLARMYMAE